MFEIIIMITLLTNDGQYIRVETNDPKISCESWFAQNVEEVEVKRIFKEPLTVHKYKDKVIVGYICSNNLPK